MGARKPEKPIETDFCSNLRRNKGVKETYFHVKFSQRCQMNLKLLVVRAVSCLISQDNYRHPRVECFLRIGLNRSWELLLLLFSLVDSLPCCPRRPSTEHPAILHWTSAPYARCARASLEALRIFRSSSGVDLKDSNGLSNTSNALSSKTWVTLCTSACTTAQPFASGGLSILLGFPES